MIEEAIILVGGLGTRLRSITKDEIPKPMVKINRRPFLEFILDYLISQGIKKVILAVGYKYEVIKNYFGNKYRTLILDYSIETKPLGTGGAIKKALEKAQNTDIFVLNGDTYFPISLRELERFHKFHTPLVTIALKKLKNVERYGTIEINSTGRVVKFKEKKFQKEGLINGGIYLINKKSFLSLDPPEIFSFEKDFLEKNYETYPIYGVVFDNYFIDIGIPEDYYKFVEDVKKGGFFR